MPSEQSEVFIFILVLCGVSQSHRFGKASTYAAGHIGDVVTRLAIYISEKGAPKVQHLSFDLAAVETVEFG
jgi:hypothetical protein